MPGLPRKVEKLWKKRAKAAGWLSISPIRTSATGRSPNNQPRRPSSVAATSWESLSYSANSRIRSRIRGTSSSVALRTSNPHPRGRLDPRADKRLGDLDGVGRRPLEQVVRYAPVLHDVSGDPQPPHVYPGIPSVLQWRREIFRVAGERHAGRAGQYFAHLLQRGLPLELDVDALGMAGVDGYAAGGRVDFEVGEIHDLARLPYHLGLLGGPSILPNRTDKGDGVAVDGLRVDVLAPVLERVHPAASRPRDRLIGRNDDLLDAELAGQRRERYHHLDGRTVGVGYEAVVPPRSPGVDLGHDERHFGMEPEITAVVYNDGPPRDGLLRELDRRAFLPLGAREKGEVHAVEGLRLGHPDLEGLPGEHRRSLAPGQNPQLLYRKVTPPQ